MENSKNNKEKNNESKKFWISSIVLLIIISVLSAIAYFVYNNNNEEKDKLILPYTELIQKINDNTVEKIEMTVGSTTVKVKLKDEEEEKTTIVPSLQAFSEYIQTKTEQGNEMEVIQKEPNVLFKIGDTIFTILPTLLMVSLIIMLFKMQGLGDKGKIYDSEEKDTEQISAASYEEKNEAYCIFVEVKRSQDVLDRYWIDTDTGLLCAAETYEEDTKVYEMTETQLRAPLEDGIVFSLPDGTILHESSSVTVPEE